METQPLSSKSKGASTPKKAEDSGPDLNNGLTSKLKDVETSTDLQKTQPESVQSLNTNAPKCIEDKGDEDVPEDFFDDFLKEDFMAGLDIVDEDNEEVVDKDLTDQTEKSNTSRTKIDHVKKFKESPPGLKTNSKFKKDKKVHKLELMKLDKELDEIRQASHKKKHLSNNLESDNFDIRRDPEKTRKAIQKDKIKSAKDKEKKLITDIVETGLVPPGMELEVDITEVKKKGITSGITDLRQKLRNSKTTEDVQSSEMLSPISDKSKKKRKSATPSKASKEKSKKSKKRKKSPVSPKSQLHKKSRSSTPVLSPEYRRSPLYRRSPFLAKYTPPRRWSPRRSRSPRIGRRSPLLRLLSRRSRSRSIDRKISIGRQSRSRDNFYKFRRDHSISPLSRRRRSYSRSPRRQRRTEKPSFLEELVAKLNETHPTPHLVQQMPPMMPAVQGPYMPPSNLVSVPVMPNVPVAPYLAPPVNQPVAPEVDQYDESFFIGSAAARPQTNQSKPEEKKQNEDKKNFLSDFLARTAKPQVSCSSTSTEKLQEKIKVIQRCQEAIKILNDRRFAGPLIIHKSSPAPALDRTVSPLLRRPIIQLPFTTPGLKTSNDLDFTTCCESLLYKLGINKVLTDRIESDNQQVPIKDAPQTNIPKHSAVHYRPPPSAKPAMKTLSCQTDKELSICKECLRRKGVLYANSSVQAGENPATFSVSTQVTEADFYSMIPKTQSLASLTPAQLLGKQSMSAEGPKINSSAIDQLRASVNRLNAQSRHIPSPPVPPPIIPFSNIQAPMSANIFSNNSPFPQPLMNILNPINPQDSYQRGAQPRPSSNYYPEERRRWN